MVVRITRSYYVGLAYWAFTWVRHGIDRLVWRLFRSPEARLEWRKWRALVTFTPLPDDPYW